MLARRLSLSGARAFFADSRGRDPWAISFLDNSFDPSRPGHRAVYAGSA
jgi:hypothetical protein